MWIIRQVAINASLHLIKAIYITDLYTEIAKERH